LVGDPFEYGGLPGLTAVSGNVHAANSAGTGPGQARYLIHSGAGQLLAAGGESNNRFWPDLVAQGDLSRVGLAMAVVVIGPVIAVDHLDPPQILNLKNTFIAGNHQPQWEALLRTHR